MSAIPVPFEQRTIGCLLDLVARAAGDRFVLRTAQERFTGAELRSAVSRVAQRLIASGIGRGDPVCVMSSTRPEMILIWLALARIGAICVPINVASKAPQLSYILKDPLATGSNEPG